MVGLCTEIQVQNLCALLYNPVFDIYNRLWFFAIKY